MPVSIREERIATTPVYTAGSVTLGVKSIDPAFIIQIVFNTDFRNEFLVITNAWFRGCNPDLAVGMLS